MTSVWNPAVFSYILRDVIENKYVLGTEVTIWEVTIWDTAYFLQIDILFKVFKIYHEVYIIYQYIPYYLDWNNSLKNLVYFMDLM